MTEPPKTPDARRGRGRTAAVLAVAAMAIAGLLAACSTTVDGTASYGGGGAIIGTDSGSVPSPSDPTVSTESSESSTPPTTTPPTTSGVDPATVAACQTAVTTAQSFLPNWDATTADPNPANRKTLAAQMLDVSNQLNAQMATIADPSLNILLDTLSKEIYGVSVRVDGLLDANLDNYNDDLSLVTNYCGI